MQYLRSPLTVPRYVLTVKYALFIALVFSGDADRLAYSVVALTVALIPTARSLQLLRRTGMKKNV